MTKDGHRLTGVLAGLTVILTGSPIAFGIALFMGVTAPDTLEVSYRNKAAYNGYSRILPHRTITHWAPLWLLFMVALWWFTPFEGYRLSEGVTTILYSVCYGYIVGALLHIFCDAGTPMGVPIWQPFGKRYSFGLYKTGGAEWRMITIVALLCLAWFAVNPYLRDILYYWHI